MARPAGYSIFSKALKRLLKASDQLATSITMANTAIACNSHAANPLFKPIAANDQPHQNQAGPPQEGAQRQHIRQIAAGLVLGGGDFARKQGAESVAAEDFKDPVH